MNSNDHEIVTEINKLLDLAQVQSGIDGVRDLISEVIAERRSSRVQVEAARELVAELGERMTRIRIFLEREELRWACFDPTASQEQLEILHAEAVNAFITALDDDTLRACGPMCPRCHAADDVIDNLGDGEHCVCGRCGMCWAPVRHANQWPCAVCSPSDDAVAKLLEALETKISGHEAMVADHQARMELGEGDHFAGLIRTDSAVVVALQEFIQENEPIFATVRKTP